MLDYTDHVPFCTKLKETLMEQKQWLEICQIQSENCRDPVLVIFLPVRNRVLMTLCMCIHE